MNVTFDKIFFSISKYLGANGSLCQGAMDFRVVMAYILCVCDRSLLVLCIISMTNACG